MKESIRSVNKIILLLAIVFFGVSLILPLHSMSATYSAFGITRTEESGIDFYIWGSYNTNTGEWSFYFSPEELTKLGNLLSGSDDVREISEGTQDELAFLGVILLIIFPIFLILLIFSIYDYIKIGRSETAALTTAIFIIIGLIVYIIVITRIVDNSKSLFQSGIRRLIIDWSFGLFFLITSLILYFINYGIQKSYLYIQKPSVRTASTMQQQFYYRKPNGFCTNCGNQIFTEQNYCQKCENKL